MSYSLVNSSQGVTRNAGDAQYPSLWRGYLGGIVPWMMGKQCFNPAPNGYQPTGSGTAYSIEGGPLGQAISMKVTGTSFQQWAAATANPFKAMPSGEGPITMQVYFRYTGASNVWLFRSDNPTVGSLHYGYGLKIDVANARLIFSTDRGNGADPQPACEWKMAASSLTTNKWHHAIVTFFSADFADVEIAEWCVMWLDGQLLFPVPPATERAFVHLSTQVSRCGSAFGSTIPEATINLLSIWNTRLGWREIDQLMTDPLAMFRRRRSGGGNFRTITPWYLAQRRRVG